MGLLYLGGFLIVAGITAMNVWQATRTLSFGAAVFTGLVAIWIAIQATPRK